MPWGIMFGLWAEILDADAFDAFSEAGDIGPGNRQEIPQTHPYRRRMGRSFHDQYLLFRKTTGLKPAAAQQGFTEINHEI